MNVSREHGVRIPRFALFMFILMCSGIMLLLPRQMWPLYGVVGGTMAYIAWRFHGIIVAVLAVVLALVHSHYTHSALAEPNSTYSFLLLTAGGLMAWSVASQRGRWRWIVPVVLVGSSLLIALVQQANSTNEIQVRLIQASAGLLVLIGCGSILLARRIGVIQTLLLVGTMVIAPAITIGAVYYSGSLDSELTHLHAWQRLPEWSAWSKEMLTKSEPWCWAPAWLVLPLMLIGFWQAWTRGRKQYRQGEAPLGWLFGTAMLLGLLATLPDDILLLHVEAILLPVFGLADIALSLVERIQLAPPPTGPADTPRVK